MTANQINYAKHREDVRHNLRSEQQKDRDLAIGEKNAVTNAYSAETGRLSHYETARHNREQESINWFQSRETARHNVVSESQFATQLAETQRHNVASEQLQSRQTAVQESQLSESIRHNSSVERETSRHNKVSELLSAGDVTTKRKQQEESVRHNMRTEEQKSLELSNQRRYQDVTGQASLITAQAKLESARQQGIANEIRSGELAENIRRNSLTLAETSRHNLRTEAIGVREAATSRLNAETREGELQVSSRRADTAQQEADTKQYEAQTKRGSAIEQGVNRSINTVSGIAKSIIGGLRNGY